MEVIEMFLMKDQVTERMLTKWRYQKLRQTVACLVVLIVFGSIMHWMLCQNLNK